jgi:aconitate hydratase
MAYAELGATTSIFPSDEIIQIDLSLIEPLVACPHSPDNVVPVATLKGIKAVIAKSFARIHKANLINNAIVPLIFESTHDYESIDEMDELAIYDVAAQIEKGIVIVSNITKGVTYKTLPEVTQREKDMLIYGGLINLMKNKKKAGA